MKTKTRIAAIALSLLGVVGAQFAVVAPAEAKSSKCVAVAVPGSPGTYVMTCTTSRP
jgi:hypothetical protein